MTFVTHNRRSRANNIDSFYLSVLRLITFSLTVVFVSLFRSFETASTKRFYQPASVYLTALVYVLCIPGSTLQV